MKLNKIFESLNDEPIEEDYPSTFIMDDFKALNSFNSRIKYCERFLQRISSGSGRIVYKIDDKKVLKLAKNKKGLAQNEVEISHGNYHDISDVIAMVFDSEPNNLWVEMELARKVRVADFKRIVGFNFKDYAKGVSNAGNAANQHKNKMKYELDKDLYQEMWDDEFVNSMFNYVASYDLPVGDLTRLNSYGLVQRYGGDYIVLVDFGLDSDVYDSYFNIKK